MAEWGPPTQSADTLYWLTRFCGEVYVEGFNQRDPRDYHVPLELITSKEYAAQRFELMRMSDPTPVGSPPYPGSNHVTVVDAQGNVASILHSVMSLPWSNGLYVDGVSNSGDAMPSLRYMRLQALLPLLVHAGEPRSALVIGLGTGITAGALLQAPGIERPVVAELLPAVVRAAPLFSGNFSATADPRLDLRLRGDDARRHERRDPVAQVGSAGRKLGDHTAVMPPSTGRVTPVT